MAAYRTDIEIAQDAQMFPISKIADEIGLPEDYLEHYGKYKAKIDYNVLKTKQDTKDGKLILVTAITPTPAGEGKTTVSVGLADGLRQIDTSPNPTKKKKRALSFKRCNLSRWRESLPQLRTQYVKQGSNILI